MKRLTILFNDDFRLEDFDEVLANAIEFHMERLPDPPSATRPKKRIGVVHRSKHMNTQLAVMEHYTPSGIFTKSLAEKWLTAHSFAITSTSPAISALKKSGHVKELEPQKYQFLKPLE